MLDVKFELNLCIFIEIMTSILSVFIFVCRNRMNSTIKLRISLKDHSQKIFDFLNFWKLNLPVLNDEFDKRWLTLVSLDDVDFRINELSLLHTKNMIFNNVCQLKDFFF